ncbi:hypothetical protein PGT21_000959 [Puccinia graminis f. sp. tritici]|uniref:Uncharacterized protein n=1 Tax=Puccinia graminis f. sp. tritici TaxID=56615 RepID=A0A5B0LPK2_PUCGR|nr:hypothetical protein PGT21_000959 [Puccinia graminis f. sp. tritici]KAA1079915.1 hypothetical protein PGTUg99_003574 [Puccinia graminis f. sp. tritici]
MKSQWPGNLFLDRLNSDTSGSGLNEVKKFRPMDPLTSCDWLAEEEGCCCQPDTSKHRPGHNFFPCRLFIITRPSLTFGQVAILFEVALGDSYGHRLHQPKNQLPAIQSQWIRILSGGPHRATATTKPRCSCRRDSVGLANLLHCADVRDVRPCLDPRPGDLEWRRRINVAVGGMSGAIFLVFCGRAAFQFSLEENIVWAGDSAGYVYTDTTGCYRMLSIPTQAPSPHTTARVSGLRSSDLIQLD